MAMDLKEILVHLDSGARTAERLGLAVALARRHGARVTGLFAESANLGASLVGRRDPENMAKAGAEAQARFDVACAGLPSRFWQLSPGEFSDIAGAAVICARHADLAIFGQHEGDAAPVPQGLVEEVIAGAGRPVLVVPSVGRYPDVGRRVVVAWTGSREATRALHDALPLLARAGSVTLLSLQLPSESHGTGLPPVDVREILASRGIQARYEPWIVHDLAAVDAVLNRASDDGADLTVIGAFGLVGGALFKRSDTTRAILETMTTPVLLSA